MIPVISARSAPESYGKKKADFSFADVKSGFLGVRDDTTDLAKFYWYARGQTACSCWVGFITGTEATWRFDRSSAFVFEPGSAVYVSVDGNITREVYLSGIQRFNLFKGLDDKKHLVAIWPISGNGLYYSQDASNTNQLTVVGRNPSLEVPQANATCGDFNPLTVQQGTMVTHDYAAIPAGAKPALLPGRISSGFVGKNVLGLDVSGEDPGPSSVIRFKSDANYIVITSFSRAVFISVDGGQVKRYDVADWNGDWGSREWPYRILDSEWYSESSTIAQNQFGKGQLSYNVLPWVCYIKLDGEPHHYNVWTGAMQGIQQIFAIAIDKPFLDVGVKRRLDQFGDSITAGLTSSSGPGECEVHEVAAYFGYAGSSHGYSGESTVNLDKRLQMLLQRFSHVTSNDVAILAEGRNGATSGAAWAGKTIDEGGPLEAISTTFPDGELIAYKNCVTQLLNRGYGKVLVRGTLPEVFPIASEALAPRNWHWHYRNASIKAMVDSFNDPRVIYIDVVPFENKWRATAGMTHPSDAGYYDLTQLCKVAYSPYLS